MRISTAKWSGGILYLTTTDPDAIRFAIGFEEGEYTLLKSKPKRSLDANAYAWVLISKLSAAMHLSKADVYRNAIKDIGGNSEVVCVQEKGLDMLVKSWESNGLGWQTETFPSKIDGCVNVILYSGSSSYDSKQMSILIDHLAEDCRALDIEVLPPEKLKSLLEKWNGS